MAEGYTTSKVAVYNYTVKEPPIHEKQTETPTADPVCWSDVAVGDTIRLSCATPGAKIYYTTDGSTPTESSTLYQEAIIVPRSAFGELFVVKVIATAEGYTISGRVDFSYYVKSPLAEKTTAPIADPEDGSELAVGDTIALSCAMSDAEIYYTLDDFPLEEKSYIYQEPIAVPDYAWGSNFTVKAIAVAKG